MARKKPPLTLNYVKQIRRLKHKLSSTAKAMKQSTSAIRHQWQHILGNKKLVVLLHRIEITGIKSDKQLVIDNESIDNEIEEEDLPLRDRLERSVISKDLSEVDQCVDTSYTSNASDSKSILHNVIKKELRVTLTDIGQSLNTENYVLNLLKNKKSSSASRQSDNQRKESDELSNYSPTNDLSCSSVKDELYCSDFERTVDTDNSNNTSSDGESKQKHLSTSRQQDRGVQESDRKVEMKKKIQDKAFNRSVKYDCNLNVITPCSKRKSTDKNNIETSSKKRIADNSLLSTLEDVDTNIGAGNTSDVSSTFDFNEDWNSTFANMQSFTKEKPIMNFHCLEDEIKNTSLDVSKSDDQKEKPFGLDNITSNSEITNMQIASKAQIPRDHKKKVQVRSSVLLADSPYTIKKLNEEVVKNQSQANIIQEVPLHSRILTKKYHIQNNHDKLRVISFGSADSMAAACNINQNVNFEKATKLNSQPISEYEKNSNRQKKDLSECLIEHTDCIQGTPIQKDTEISSKMQNCEAMLNFETSETDTCSSSESSQEAETSSIESSSEGTDILVNENKTVGNRKRKCKDIVNLDSSNQNISKRIKLNRSSWRNVKRDRNAKNCYSTDSISLASTHLPSSPNDMDSSSEMSKNVLNYCIKQMEYGCPASKNSIGSSESSKNTEVIMVAADSTAQSHLADQPTGFSPNGEIQQISNVANCQLLVDTSVHEPDDPEVPLHAEVNTSSAKSQLESQTKSANYEDNLAVTLLCSKQRSTHENNIKTSTKEEGTSDLLLNAEENGEISPNTKTQTISDVVQCRVGFHSTLHKSRDPKFKLSTEASTSTRRSAKSRLGPQAIVRESKSLEFKSIDKVKASPSAKSRLGSAHIKAQQVKSPSKSKAIIPSTEITPADVGRSERSSPYTCLANQKLSPFNKGLQNYKIPKIKRDAISESTDSNSQNSKTPENSDYMMKNGNSDDEDYICLHPEESFSDFEEEFSDPDSKKTSSQTAESFSMTDSVFDRYLTRNQSEFDVQYENIKNAGSQNSVFEKEESVESLKSQVSLSKNDVKSNVTNNTLPHSGHVSVLENTARRHVEIYFMGYCFAFLKFGRCIVEKCKFNHDVSVLISQILSEKWTQFLDLINRMTYYKYFHFMKVVIAKKMFIIEATEIFSLLKVLYTGPGFNMYRALFLNAIDALRAHRVTLKDIISEFLTFISDDSNKHILFYAVKERTSSGNLWDTTKDLVLSIKSVSTCPVSDIMLECVQFRLENAEDVNARLVAPLAPLVRATIDSELMKRFKSVLVEPVQRHNDTSLMMASQSNDMPIIFNGMSSQDPIKLDNSLQDYNNVTSASTPVRTNPQNVFSPRKISNVKDDNNNINETSNAFAVEKIDNIPTPSSIFRGRFSKFYHSLDILREALSQENYPFVIQILEYARSAQQDKTFYTLSCYRILCQEIKLSAHHMNKIKMLTVQMNIDFALRKSLADITKCILIRLVDEGLYILANSLLENWKEHVDCNASFALLMAEIYLGSDQPLEAFDVLRRHNILHSNRDKWTLLSDAKDECVRAKLLPIVLNALSITNPDHALFLFKFLMDIQSSNFQPIDLTRCADALVTAVLLTGDMALIEHAGRLIFEYNISLAAITYRALIATVISENVLLAKQLYRSAMSLGIYTSGKFHPVTHIIVDPDWSYEEVYLAFEKLMKDILINVGPGLDHLSARQISVYVVLESIPSDKPPVLEETTHMYDVSKRFLSCKRLIRNVLVSRFEPPIKLSRRGGSKICRLQSKDIIHYLRAGHV